MSAEDVAKAADTFFDRQGRPTEKSLSSVNHVTSFPTTSSTLPRSTVSSTASSSSFTAAFSDEDTDVNFVNRNGSRGNDRGRSGNQGPRSRSRPGPNRFPNSSSTAGPTASASNDSRKTFPQGTCRWHRRFGDKSLKCVTDCPQFKNFSATQKQGNANGGRRQ